ncbi:MAG: FAD-dependent 5-carboxymethylaminomethyl-2-thiouridine(34) oxidoreductase MnmC [Hyphomonadaceae bacterium]
MPRLPPQPDLDWRDGQARSIAFNDVYFSRDGGLAESEAVFLAGCGLPDRWATRDRFAICELGFGSGLNVLAAWRAWRSTRRPHAILHIHTIEAFPLATADAARALAAFPEVADLASRLLVAWPVRAYAPQRFWLPEDGLAITVCIGDAAEVLSRAGGQFDAFFLDGFAPSRNPAMWAPEIYPELARLAAPGARAATYSVAGDVRRSLEAAGFSVERKPGFGAKRERLEAHWRGAECEAEQRPRRVAVLGAGIAGASAARALRRRNVETCVLDAAPALGAGASGNPAGLVMPRLDRGYGAARELFLAAYLDAVAAYAAMGEDVFEPCGVVQRATPALCDLIADPPLPADWMHAAADGAVLHVRAGLVRPRSAIKHMLEGSHVMLDAAVGGIERADGRWRVLGADGRAILTADAIVLACGAALRTFEGARFLPIALSRGQIEWGPLSGALPQHALTDSTYVAPFEDGLLFGATFDPVDVAIAPVAADAPSRDRNLAALFALAPELAGELDVERLRSRAALRATTPDRMPIAGALPDAPAWLAANADVRRGAAPHAHPMHPGVYVLGGLGARGLTLAPLLGETVAAAMFDEPHILSNTSLRAIAPARFLHRALKRGG